MLCVAAVWAVGAVCEHYQLLKLTVYAQIEHIIHTRTHWIISLHDWLKISLQCFEFAASLCSSQFRVSQIGLALLIPLNVAAWFMGTLAVYNQQILYFTAALPLNIGLGALVLSNHALTIAEVWMSLKTYLSLFLQGVKSVPCEKQYFSVMTAFSAVGWSLSILVPATSVQFSMQFSTTSVRFSVPQVQKGQVHCLVAANESLKDLNFPCDVMDTSCRKVIAIDAYRTEMQMQLVYMLLSYWP